MMYVGLMLHENALHKPSSRGHAHAVYVKRLFGYYS